MPLQLHCPHCGGLFQIDEALSGQHVGCPFCASVVAIAEFAPAAMGGYGPPPAPPEFPIPPELPRPPEFSAPPDVPGPPTAGEEAFPLGCPACGGPFQVTREMSGQQIACPHCHSVVLLPDFGPALPAPPGENWSEYAAPPAADYRPPEHFEAGPGPSQAPQPTSDPQPSAVTPGESVDELLPPAADRRKPTVVAPDAHRESTPLDAEQELPPAATPKKRKAPKPVGAGETSLHDELLPPAARQKSADQKIREKSDVEELLPPAAERPPAKDRAAQPKTEEAARKPRRPGEAADGSVLIPTAEGKYIALREPVKTVSVGGREVELRRLSPEEKAARRFKRNFFVAVFGMLFLIVFLFVAAFLRGI
jgi:hypothetical protein